MAKKRGSRANRNWATGGGALAGNLIGASVGMAGGPIGAGIGGWTGGIAGAAIARRAYSNRHTMTSNPRGSKGPHRGAARRSGGGHGRRQRRDSHGKFA